MMSLQSFLESKFSSWRPQRPLMLSRSRRGVALNWAQDLKPFGFLGKFLLYRIERKEKIPPWLVVYSGGKTTKMIDDLAPNQPHKFRLKIILKSDAVKLLSEKALEYYGNENDLFDSFKLLEEHFDSMENVDKISNVVDEILRADKITGPVTKHPKELTNETKADGDKIKYEDAEIAEKSQTQGDGDKDKRPGISSVLSTPPIPWLESSWSEEVWASTDSEGASVRCFCMAVHCGYLKQIQQMLDERPELIGAINMLNGFTPLITAVRKGDIATVRFLVSAGAELNQRAAASQTPLHFAAFADNVPVLELLLDRGADIQDKDCNGLRAEHYAAAGVALGAVRALLARGGGLHYTDYTGWTPLYTAVVQGAPTSWLQELIELGADTEVVDRSGLSLATAAALLTDSRGRPRSAARRLTDPQYPHEKAVTQFTRLARKINSLSGVFKQKR